MKDLVKRHSEFIGSPIELHLEKSKYKEVAEVSTSSVKRRSASLHVDASDTIDNVKDKIQTASSRSSPRNKASATVISLLSLQSQHNLMGSPRSSRSLTS